MKRKSSKFRAPRQPSRNRSPLTRGQQARGKQQHGGLDYQSLEKRQLLATGLGVNLTGHTYQTQSFDKEPNMVGDIGTTHYFEAIGDKISAFNRNTGTRDIYKTQTQFWLDAGITITSDTGINNAQPIFDRFANRWLIIGEGNATSGNYLYIAISNTANPVDGFKATRFVGDSTGIRHNGEVAVAIDADALLITTRNTTTTVGFPPSVSIFSIPRGDLYLVFPTLTNMTRHENLNRNTYGDMLRPASSFEASDGKASFVGHSVPDGAQTIRTDLFNVNAFGATLGPAQIIDFDPHRLFTYFRNASEGVPVPDPRQTEVNNIDQFLRAKVPTGVPVSSVINNVIDVGGGLWYAQVINADIYLQTGTPFNGIVVYEINKARNELDHANLIIAPETAMFPNTEEWDLYNPSLAVNKYGVVVLNYTISSPDNETNPSAASSIGITVNGISVYDPIFDTINVPPKPWIPPNPLPYRFDRPGRNTQFELIHNFPDDDRLPPQPDDDPNEDRDDFIQEGFEPFLNGEFATNISSWSRRASANFDPLNENRFWVSTQWANVQSRWSTQITQVIPNKMRPVLTGDYADNVFVFRRNAADTNLLEIEIDGVVTDILPFEVLGNVVINGYDGADRFILDYSNGDPIPSEGFTFNGMRGSDTVETNDPNGGRFVVDGRPVDQGPTWLAYGTSTGDGSGTYNEKSFFVNVEELIGGPGNDHFLVTDFVDEVGNVYFGFLAGSLTGNGGDDLFEFAAEGGRIGDSVYGNEGYNTLSFQNRVVDTKLTLLGYGGLSGYEGRSTSPDGPIGDSQVFDRFSNINFVRGSDTAFDSIVGLDFLTHVFVDDENSTYETNGVFLGFFEVNSIDCSSFNDEFIGIRNSVNPLQLNGLGGDDVYYFSSDGTGLMGSTAPLGNVLFAQGGTGVNQLYVSNRGGGAAGTPQLPALILNNRISGMGEIAYNSVGGVFHLHVWASEFADRIDLHSFLPGNTLELFLLGGNDIIDIQDLSKAFVDVYGGAGDDLYIIQKVQGVDFRNLVLHDSVGAERDRVTLAGTILDEIFFITNTTFVDTNVVYSGIETFGVEGRGGNDTFNVLEADYELFIDGQEGNDIFNFSSNAPTNTGTIAAITGLVSIEGGVGQNQLRISYLNGAEKDVTISANSITGMFAQPFSYLSTGGTFSLANGIGGITVTGSNAGIDLFNVIGLNVDDSLRILGSDGNDAFTVGAGALGRIQLEGGNGVDTFTVNLVGSGNREVVVNDTGAPGSSSKLDVIGTAGSDLLTITSQAISRGSEMVKVQAALSLLQVFGRNGNDEMTLTGATALTAKLFGEAHDDKFTINGTTGITNLEVNGDTGNDLFTFQTVSGATTTVNGFGGDGNDIYHVGVNAVPNIKLNGQEGSDRYNVTFMAAGSREVDTRDTGVGSNDVLNVMASAGDDLVAISIGQVSKDLQNVLFNSNTERLVVNVQAGLDTVDVTGSAAGSTLIQGNEGDDKVTILSTLSSPQLTVDGGLGDDIFVVKSTEAMTRTTLYGKDGDDRFNVGSTLEENLGNLGLIHGNVAAIGGFSSELGQDRLYVNDIIGNAPFAYNLTANFIKPLAGPNNLARPEFFGITFDGSMEHVRLDGTLFPNFFSIEASPKTEFFLNGNLPSPNTPNGDFVYLRAKPNDGHVIRITDAARGRGYISFTNGDEFIRFDNIEGTFATNPQAMPPAGGGFGGPSMMKAPGGQQGPSMLMAMDNLAGQISLSEDADDEFAAQRRGRWTPRSADLDDVFSQLS